MSEPVTPQSIVGILAPLTMQERLRTAQAIVAAQTRIINYINEQNYTPAGKAHRRFPHVQERLEANRYVRGLKRGYDGDFAQWKRDRATGRAPVPRNAPGFVERQPRTPNLKQGDLF